MGPMLRGTAFALPGGVDQGDKNVEDTKLGTQSCPLCGNETPKGHRYCRDCDAAGSYSTSGNEGERRSAPPARRGGSSVPLVLLFFVLSAFGTVMAGIFAPSALPLLGEVTSPGTVQWGELRVAKVTSNIRAQASTSSEIVGQLTAGDSVRVEAVSGGWFEVYEAPLVRRSEAKPLGYVFGRLLLPADAELVSEADNRRLPPAEHVQESSRKSGGRGS